MMRRRRVRSPSPSVNSKVIINASQQQQQLQQQSQHSVSPSLPWHMLQVGQASSSSCAGAAAATTTSVAAPSLAPSTAMSRSSCYSNESRCCTATNNNMNQSESPMCTESALRTQLQSRVASSSSCSSMSISASSCGLRRAHQQQSSPNRSLFSTKAVLLAAFQQEQQQQHKQRHLEQTQQQQAQNNQHGDDDSDTNNLYPLNQLPERFANVRYISAGGYGKVFAATDLSLVASTAVSNNNSSDAASASCCAVKVMDFICDQEDARRMSALAEYGNLAALIAGQEYVPSHISTELQAHGALRDVVGAMPLRRAEMWCEPTPVTGGETAAAAVRVWVMLVLPLLTPLHSKFFFTSGAADNDESDLQQQQQLLSATLQIATTLREMHARNWLHRDLSVTNIFLDPSAGAVTPPKAIIGDFGLAACVRGRCSAAMQFSAPAANACTTIWYRSPEILADPKNTPYTADNDAWSLGAVVCELALGGPVFPGVTREEQRGIIDSALGSAEKAELFRQSLIEEVQGERVREVIVRAALQHLLQREPTRRSVDKFIDAVKRAN